MYKYKHTFIVSGSLCLLLIVYDINLYTLCANDRDDTYDGRCDVVRQNSTMLFYDELNVKLIRFVKQNPMLYDHNHEKYSDINAKEVVWQKIGDELKRSACSCKLRWINIRDAYRRILRKSVKSGQRPKPYRYEKEICFLRPFYKDVSVQIEEFESDNQGNDNCGDEDDIGSDNSDVTKEIFKLTRAFNFKPKKSKKKERNRSVKEDTKASTLTETTDMTAYDSSDTVDIFLSSIGATLKTFSDYHLNLVKSKIFAIVQEHDLQQIVENLQPIEVTQHDIKMSGTEIIYIMQ